MVRPLSTARFFSRSNLTNNLLLIIGEERSGGVFEYSGTTTNSKCKIEDYKINYVFKDFDSKSR
jgi:hypothetical protein